MASDDHHHHVVLFPFMSKGHTIPFLHLARLLVSRKATVTLFSTPANQPFMSNYLSDLSTEAFSIVALPFPENIGDGVPPGTESTDKLPEISLWVPFARATYLMKPYFEQSLETLPGPPVTFMVTDGFLPWTLDSAKKCGSIPRLVYQGMSHFARAVCYEVMQGGLIHQTNSDDEPFPLPHFPRVKVTRNDFEPPFTDREPSGPHFEFVMDTVVSTINSSGQIVNSFYELEPAYADFNPNTWSVGPLCLAEPPRVKPKDYEKTPWIEWLDGMLDKGKTVLYVAFGSQAEISPEQFQEIRIGLEKSEVNFLWVVRKNESELADGFEDRVRGRGLVVREWVNQMEILGHQSVQGFLSHCGWNSVLESICAKVPILAWPMMAEQPLNARFVAEEIKVGIKVETCNGSVRGFVTAEGLEKGVKELMEGELGKEARKKVKEFGDSAMKALQEGGSSWKALNDLLNQLHSKKHK